MAKRNSRYGYKRAIMNFLNYQSHLKVLLNNYRSCSLVNGDGQLLYSKDNNPEVLTTTRLVAFQIIKKYLNPRPKDLFILNDPENGGYEYSKLIFLTCLNSNLYLIWDDNNYRIDFKIPPTPLFEAGVRNDFIWNALIKANKHADELESYFNNQKEMIDRILKLDDQLKNISDPKKQQSWLKAANEAFLIQFDSKAHGSVESYHALTKNHIIKLKVSAEEKQNLKLITLDFTNTNLANNIYAASHVIESALVKKITDFYQIEGFLCQSILDKIKIVLPPRSIVSKAHPTGEFNYELQSICSQLCEHNLKQLNSNTRKQHARFEYNGHLNFELQSENTISNNFFSSQTVLLNEFDKLITNNLIKVIKMSRTDNTNHLVFEVVGRSEMKVFIKNNYYNEKSDNVFKLNNKVIERGHYPLSAKDVVEIIWQ